MSYLVIDFEATCWANERYPENQEIIEFGAVLLDSSYNIVSTFESLVKPKINPEISEYCTELTGITQEDIDTRALGEFPEVYREFLKWLGKYTAACKVFSWGDFDRKLLKDETERYVIQNKFLNWCDLSTEFREVFKRKRKYGLKKALRYLNLEMTGQHHRALSDAMNAAKVIPFIIAKDYANKIEEYVLI